MGSWEQTLLLNDMAHCEKKAAFDPAIGLNVPYVDRIFVAQGLFGCEGLPTLWQVHLNWMRSRGIAYEHLSDRATPWFAQHIRYSWTSSPYRYTYHRCICRRRFLCTIGCTVCVPRALVLFVVGVSFDFHYWDWAASFWRDYSLSLHKVCYVLLLRTCWHFL